MDLSNLRKLRSEKGLLQKDIAKYLGISVAAYSLYENSKRTPTVDILKKLCEFYEIDMESLLGWRDSKQTHKIIDSSFEDKRQEDCLSYEQSYSYADSEEEFNKQQKEHQIEIKKKKHNNVHKYDASIRIKPTPEQIEKYQKNEEAREIIKRQESGEEITDEERQKISDYIERKGKDYKEALEELRKLEKTVKRYLSASIQASNQAAKASAQMLKEKYQMLVDLIPTELDNYENLNDVGQQKAADYISDLSSIPEYRKNPEEDPLEPPQD